MAGVFGKGTLFQVTIGSTLTSIAELTNIGGLELTADEVDVSSHDSDDDYREFLQGMKDGGSVDIEGNFINDSSQSALKTLFDAGTTVAMKIVFPGTLGEWAFDAFVTSIGTDAPFEDKLGFTASVKVTGKPVLS